MYVLGTSRKCSPGSLSTTIISIRRSRPALNYQIEAAIRAATLLVGRVAAVLISQRVAAGPGSHSGPRHHQHRVAALPSRHCSFSQLALALYPKVVPSQARISGRPVFVMRCCLDAVSTKNEDDNLSRRTRIPVLTVSTWLGNAGSRGPSLRSAYHKQLPEKASTASRGKEEARKPHVANCKLQTAGSLADPCASRVAGS